MTDTARLILSDPLATVASVGALLMFVLFALSFCR